MGILPLQFVDNQNITNLGLTGKELYSVILSADLKPRQFITVQVSDNGFF